MSPAQWTETDSPPHDHHDRNTLPWRLLSGLSFRATFYHLGVVRFFRDSGALQDVIDIASVSGGSILAAHLVLNWNRYNGDDSNGPRSFFGTGGQHTRATWLRSGSHGLSSERCFGRAGTTRLTTVGSHHRRGFDISGLHRRRGSRAVRGDTAVTAASQVKSPTHLVDPTGPARLAKLCLLGNCLCALPCRSPLQNVQSGQLSR